MPGFAVAVTGASEAAGSLTAAAAAVDAVLNPVVAAWAAVYVAQVKILAPVGTGRHAPYPGGEEHYRDTIVAVPSEAPWGPAWEAYTDAPQANRLEYGFVGADRLGRHFNQAPRPHWGPPVEPVADGMAAQSLQVAAALCASGA